MIPPAIPPTVPGERPVEAAAVVDEELWKELQRQRMLKMCQ